MHIHIKYKLHTEMQKIVTIINCAAIQFDGATFGEKSLGRPRKREKNNKLHDKQPK